MALRTRRPIAGALAGQHSSPRHGSSTDFADHRPYAVGDDFRRIDHHVLARLDQLVVKLFDADDDLTVHFLLDDSGSMAWHGKDLLAAQLVAALGFVTLRRNDTVVLHSLRRPPIRCSGRNGLPTLLHSLAQNPSAGETDLAAAVSRCLQSSGPGVVIIVSDFLTADWQHALRSARRRQGDQGIAVHVVHPDELKTQMGGDLEFVDTETGEVVPVSLGPATRRAQHEAVNEWLSELERACARLGFDHTTLLATDNLDRHLVDRWRAMELLR